MNLRKLKLWWTIYYFGRSDIEISLAFINSNQGVGEFYTFAKG